MKEFFKKNKVVVVLLLIVCIIFAIKSMSGEDSWICKEGQWVKHGNPSSPAPINGCGASPLVGGDKDAHGCIPSAGYSWCEIKQKCLRLWEESCEAQNAAVSLPVGYSLEKYEIRETLDVSCKKDEECETPGRYLVQSNCPYTSLCLKNKCNVVCPNYSGAQN